MRGRTLNDAFVILDEAQNTTIEQMKMFLTRLGFGSKAVVTGDITQIDLPTGRTRGWSTRCRWSSGIEGIAFVHFDERDVVRHKLVQSIVKRLRIGVDGAATARRDARGLRRAMAVPARPAARLTSRCWPRMDPGGRRRTGAWLREVAPRTARGEVTVALVSDRRMRSLNRSFRGVDAATDVLSFPVAATPPERDVRAQRRGAPASGEPVRSATSSSPPASRRARPRRPATPSAPSCGSSRCTGCCTCSATTTRPTTARMARTEQRLRRRGRLREGLIERAAPARPREGRR